MAIHRGSTRKRTGGRKRPYRDDRKYERGRSPTETVVGDTRLKVIDARGGVKKVRALATDKVLLATGDETETTTVENVLENPANPNYVRRNIVTKGTVIETPKGQARVTSRPGQTGQICAVLIEE